MQSILDAINEWIKEILIGAINGNLSTMFGDVNEKVGTIAAEVGQTPQGWNANIFSMIQTLSENVIVPIAGLVISGSLNVFNHRTNVELSNRLVCFDIKQLGKQLKKLGMLIVQDQVWNRVTVNRAERKSTRYFMDEFHLLLKEEQTAAYSVEIWKRFRKWGGIPTAITQNVKDLLASREVENIFENSDFVLMLNQAAGDRAILLSLCTA